MALSGTVVVISGPTGAGKSGVAVQVCRAILDRRLAPRAEVVSVDAVAVVRGADIGSAKTTEEERMGVPHHLIDVIDPWQGLNVVEWATMAKAVISDIVSAGGVAVLCGGSAMYLTWLLQDRETETVQQQGEEEEREEDGCGDGTRSKDGENIEKHPARQRAQVKEKAAKIVQRAREDSSGIVFEEERWKELIGTLASENGIELCEDSKNAVNVNDWFRLKGLLERALCREETAAAAQSRPPEREDCKMPHPDVWKVFICCPRDRVELYRKIDRRCEEMLSNSLIEETYRLEKLALANLKGREIDSNSEPHAKKLKIDDIPEHSGTAMWRVAIGYKQVRQLLAVFWRLEDEGQTVRQQIVREFIENFQRDTRNLAKKQLTWFRKLKNAAWTHTGTGSCSAKVAVSIVEHLIHGSSPWTTDECLEKAGNADKDALKRYRSSLSIFGEAKKLNDLIAQIQKLEPI